jgi:cellulase/cellobiase CelA1
MNTKEFLDGAVQQATRLFKAADSNMYPGIEVIMVTVPGTIPETAHNYMADTADAAAHTVLEENGISYENPQYQSLRTLVTEGVSRAIKDYDEVVSARAMMATELSMSYIKQVPRIDSKE